MSNKYKMLAAFFALILVIIQFVYSAFRGEMMKDNENEMTISEESSVASETSDSIDQVKNDEIQVADNQILIESENPFLIKGRVYRQGDIRYEDYGMEEFGFNGDLEISVSKASVYTYKDGMNILNSDFDRNKYESLLSSMSDLTDPVFLVLDVVVNNKSAEYLFGIKYQFNASVFELKTIEDYAYENYSNPYYFPKTQDQILNTCYFEAHDMENEQNYYAFNLPIGEVLETQIGFWLDQSVFDDKTLVLKIGNTYENRFGIILNEIEDKRE